MKNITTINHITVNFIKTIIVIIIRNLAIMEPYNFQNFSKITPSKKNCF